MRANPGTWPLWLRSQVGGLIWAAGMYLMADGPRTGAQALIYLTAGPLFGIALWAGLRIHYRRVFGDLDEAEQRDVARAVKAARPPDDPRLRDAAIRLARTIRRRRAGTVTHLILFGFFTLLCVYLALAVAWWAGFGVLFFPVAGWLSWRDERRQQDAADGFLTAAKG